MHPLVLSNDAVLCGYKLSLLVAFHTLQITELFGRTEFAEGMIMSTLKHLLHAELNLKWYFMCRSDYFLSRFQTCMTFFDHLQRKNTG